jgi:hypothetical protein
MRSCSLSVLVHETTQETRGRRPPSGYTGGARGEGKRELNWESSRSEGGGG